MLAALSRSIASSSSIPRQASLAFAALHPAFLHSSASTMSEQRKKVADAKQAPRPGQMAAFTFAGQGDDAVEVLVTNVGGKLSAINGFCTHYGAPLKTGVMSATGRILCPWHGACFDAQTGDIEDAPGLDSLEAFKVEQDDKGDVYVTADPEKLKKGNGRRPPACKSGGALASDADKGVVVVGGGSAATHFVESARKNGFTGPITVLSAESYAPIDRTKLSKALMTDASALALRSPAHLKNVLKVQLETGTEVASVDVSSKSLKTSSGKTIGYDKLVLATGGAPRWLPVPGAKQGELKNVFTLRHVEDAQGIVSAIGDAKDKDVVVIGSSFIGAEVANAVAGQKKAKSVSVVGMEKVPFERILGDDVGKAIQNALAKNGITFHMSAGVESVQGDQSGSVSSVVIKADSGEKVTLPAHVVILGVGVAPATKFLSSSPGFPELNKDGSVAVNASLEVVGLEGKGVFALGDIAQTPGRNAGDSGRVRIEHWNVAGNQGRHLGALIATGSEPAVKAAPMDKTAIFWSALGSQLRYVSDGDPPGFDEVHIDGDASALKFVAYYAQKDQVRAVATMGRDPVMTQVSELLRLRKLPKLSEIKSTDIMSLPLGTSAQL